MNYGQKLMNCRIMRIWLINDGENLPVDGKNPRLQRMGLLAKMLASKNVEVTWWQSTFNHYRKEYRFNEDKDVQIEKRLLLKMLHSGIGYSKNVSVRRLVHQWHMGKKFYDAACKEIKPDLILCCMPTLEFLHFAVKYAKKNNIPYIVDVRDLNPDVFLQPFHGVLRSAVKIGIKPMQWSLTKGLKGAKGLAATSEPYMEWALKYARRMKTENDNVFYVAYPDCNVPSSLSEDSRWKKYEGRTGLLCSFFGQFGKLVDYETIIRTAEICKDKNLDVKFLLCGNGELLEHYQNVVKEKHLENVEIPGWVNQTDISDIGFISDIGLMAYYPNEAFNMQMPNKFSEYLALGLAIALQPVGIMREKIEQNQCGFHYETEQQLYEQLKYLVEHPAELATMKKNSRKLFEQAFSSSVVNEEYANYLINNAK